MDRTDVGIFIERIAGSQRFEADFEFGEHRLGDGFLD
jgi:hypothetical protein